MGAKRLAGSCALRTAARSCAPDARVLGAARDLHWRCRIIGSTAAAVTAASDRRWCLLMRAAAPPLDRAPTPRIGPHNGVVEQAVVAAALIGFPVGREPFFHI